MMPEWIIQVIGFAGAGTAAYSAIRADLARLHEKIEHAREVAERAERRVDRIYDQDWKKA
jgi:hypothetical protein